MPSNGHRSTEARIQQTLSPRPLLPPGVDLPRDIGAEASVLGGVILHNDWLRQLDQLRTDDFYDIKHRTVWEAMRNLEARGKPIDIVMLEHEIERAGRGDGVGIAFLGELALHVPTVDNVRAYADVVRQHSRNRQAVIALSSMAYRALNWAHDPSELISEIRGELGRLDDLSKSPAKRLKLMSVAQAIEDNKLLAAAPVFPTPFDAVNDAIGFGGFKGTQAYTVCAGTGRGKTSFVTHLGAHVAEQGSFTIERGARVYLGAPVLIVSYEMKPAYFIARKAAGVLGVHSNQIISGEIDMSVVLRAMPYPRMFFMHRPSLAELREAVEYLKEKFDAAPFVVIDYIQKLADQIASSMPRPDLRMATNEASATILDIAEKTNAAIVAVSAIGRGKGKILSNPRKEAPYDLVEVAKESGAVEFDTAALIVLSLHKEYDAEERIATVTMAKTRFGSECHIDARFHGPRGSWRTLERVEVEDKPSKDPGGAKGSFTEDLKRRIHDELFKQPAPSRNALYARVKGNKKLFTDAFAELLNDGAITKNAALPGDGFVVVGSPHDPAGQPSLDLPGGAV